MHIHIMGCGSSKTMANVESATTVHHIIDVISDEFENKDTGSEEYRTSEPHAVCDPQSNDVCDGERHPYEGCLECEMKAQCEEPMDLSVNSNMLHVVSSSEHLDNELLKHQTLTSRHLAQAPLLHDGTEPLEISAGGGAKCLPTSGGQLTLQSGEVVPDAKETRMQHTGMVHDGVCDAQRDLYSSPTEGFYLTLRYSLSRSPRIQLLQFKLGLIDRITTSRTSSASN